MVNRKLSALSASYQYAARRGVSFSRVVEDVAAGRRQGFGLKAVSAPRHLGKPQPRRMTARGGGIGRTGTAIAQHSRFGPGSVSPLIVREISLRLPFSWWSHPDSTYTCARGIASA